MVRGFSEQEKEIIRNKLLEKGKEYLEQYGIRKTNVEELTRAAGISKGAFYLFFNSKEELFFQILGEYEHEIRQILVQDVFVDGGNHKESFKQCIGQLLDVVEKSPLMNQFNKEEFEYLLRKLPPEVVQEHMKKDDDFVFQFIQEQVEQGIFNEVDTVAVSGFFKTLFLLCINREELGTNMYYRTRDLLIELLANHVVKQS